MWKNLGNAVTSTLQHVKKLQSELENQLDEAVGNNDRRDIIFEGDAGKLDAHCLTESNNSSKIFQMVSVSEQSMKNSEQSSEVEGYTDSCTLNISVDVNENSESLSKHISNTELDKCAVTTTLLRESGENSPISQSSKQHTCRDDDAKISDIKNEEENSCHNNMNENSNGVKLVENEIPSNGDSSNKPSIDSKLTEMTFEVLVTNESAIAPNKSGSEIDELLHLREALTERERSLEALLTRMHEVNMNLEESEKSVCLLKVELEEKNNRLDQSQLSTQGEAKIKKLNEIIAEKDEKLLLFEREGNLLSKKQSELEKLLKQQKKDVKEKSAEISKLKESKEQLVKAIEEMQDVIRKNEGDLNNASKSISAITAVNQNANDKFAKLESEILMKSEEIISQRKSLESAWSENNELKRALVELKNERDDFKRQLGEGASRFVENESSSKNYVYILLVNI